MRLKIVHWLYGDTLTSEIRRLERKKLSKIELQRLRELKDAYNAYLESGEIFGTKENVKIITPLDLRKIATPLRLELLDVLKSREFESISELARVLNRDIKNVFDDLKLLENYNLLKLKKNKNKSFVMANVKEINIEF